MKSIGAVIRRVLVVLSTSILALSGVIAFAQTNLPPTWVFARAYNGWNIVSQQADTYTFNGGVCNFTPSTNGNVPSIFVFSGYQAGVQVFYPVAITDQGVGSTTSEIVTPTATIQSASSCGFSASTLNSHTSFVLSSGTAGLQEAIVTEQQTAPVFDVILDKYWYQTVAALPGNPTPASIIASVKGNSDVGIVDTTTLPWTYYSWNGTNYVASAPTGSLAITSVTPLAAPAALSSSATTNGIITTSSTGGTIPITGSTYRLAATYVTAIGGETTISSDSASTITTGTSTATNSITVTSPAAETGAVGWRLYVSPAGDNSSVTTKLGVAANYALLGYSGITNTGSTVVTGGNIGSSPTASITGFPAGVLTPPAVIDNTNAAAAQTALTAAISYYQGLSATLSGLSTLSTSGNGSTASTYTSGVYTGTALTMATGIILDAQNNPNATFVFVSSSTINLATGQSVVLVNGAKASNVVFVAGSAFTSVATSTVNGNILAVTSITLGGGILNGRALASTGAVTISAATAVTVAATGSTGTETLYASSCASASTGQTVLNGVCAIGSSATITTITSGTATVPAINNAFLTSGGTTSPLQAVLSSYPSFTAVAILGSGSTGVLAEINLPAGYLNSLGRTIRICGSGFATTNSTAGTLTLATTLASIPGVTTITPFTAVSGATTASAAVNFNFCTDWTTTATGATGTLEAHGWANYTLAGTAVASPAADIIRAASASVNLTAQDQIAVTLTPATTAITTGGAQLRQLTVEVLQ
jgi:hypothetical protein